jgi:putative transposase
MEYDMHRGWGLGEIIREIAENHGFEIDTMEIAQDHMHIFLSFPPRYSISRVVGMLKSISASVIFEEHPEVKRDLWGGEFWEDGYFVRTVGDKVTAEVIRKYIEYHREEERTPRQLELF